MSDSDKNVDTDFDNFQDSIDDHASGLTKCIHKTVEGNGGVLVCTECGEEIERNISGDKDWRYYGQFDTKHMSDPSRCQARKVDEKSIFKDVEGMGFPDKIVSHANRIFLSATCGNIHRGDARRAIIFGSMHEAYKLSDPGACDGLVKVFNITPKRAHRGIKLVRIKAAKDLLSFGEKITPAVLVGEIMDIFNARQDQKDEVVKLYERVRNRSSKINQPRPNTVAAGLVYYWILNHNKHVTLKEFSKKVGLSGLTISRISEEIESLIGT